ncbi:mannosyltransferase [Dispira parvispora]|uniref:Mannosyltransferase n=1 Tax=Dispira parvispora TaxID=1520584 RepID=A0A9W8AWU8_9FUNG|nr:mannosyltransferase [Dispira parvispora]
MPQNNSTRHTSSPTSVRRRRQTTNHGNTQEPPTEQPTINTPKESAKPLPQNSDAIYLPSFTVAFRLLACVRILAGVLLSMSDSRESLTAWEPLHYLQFGYGIQPTDSSTHQPASLWVVTALQALLARGVFLLSLSQHKPILFFTIQLLQGALSAACETQFYRAVTEHVHPRVGRYTLVAMLGSAGLARAAISLEPSRLAMCLLMLASPYLFRRPSMVSGKRVYYGLFWVGLATMLGWSVALVVALPLLVEELCYHGVNHSLSTGSEEATGIKRWRLTRCIRVGVGLGFVAVGALLVLVWSRWLVQKWEWSVLWPTLDHTVMDKESDLPYYNSTWLGRWLLWCNYGWLDMNVLYPLAWLSLPCVAVIGWLHRHGISRPSGYTTEYPVLLSKTIYFYVIFGTLLYQSDPRRLYGYLVQPFLCLSAAISLYTFGVVTGVLHSRGHALTQPLVYGRYFYLSVYILVGVIQVASQCYFFHGPLTLFQGFAHRVVQPSHKTTLGLALSSPLTHPLLCLYPSAQLFASHYFVPEPYRVRFIETTEDIPTHGISKSYAYYPSSPTVTNSTKEVPLSTWPTLIAQASQNIADNDRVYSNPDDHGSHNLSALGTAFEPCHYLLALQREVKYVDDSDVTSSLPPAPWIQSELTWKLLGCQAYLDTERTWWPLQQLYLPMWLRRGLQRVVDLGLGSTFPWDMTLYWNDVCLFVRQEQGTSNH